MSSAQPGGAGSSAPAKKRAKSTAGRTQIMVALIAAIATVIVAVIGIVPQFRDLIFRSGDQQATVSLRVADPTGSPIGQAKALVFYKGGPITTLTDSNGAANLAVPLGLAEYRLVIEKDGYGIYESGMDPTRDENLQVQLTARQGQEARVVIRVVDDANSEPIEGANVLLLVQGNSYTQGSDSNGIAKFSLIFPPQGDLDVELSVRTRDYSIESQRITLSRDRAQDIRLDRSAQTVRRSDVEAQPAPGNPAGQGIAASGNGSASGSASRHVPCANALAYGQIFDCTLSDGTQTMTHTIDAATDDTIVFTVARTAELFEPAFQVYSADGNAVPYCGAEGSPIAEVTCRLRATGAYSIVVRDRRNKNPGSYLVYTQRLNNPGNPTPLVYGKPITDEMVDIAQRNTYSFSVGVDDMILFTMTRLTGEYQPSFQVYNANGDAVPYCGAESNQIAEVICRLPSAGAYSIQVLDRSRSRPGSYRVFIQNFSHPENAPELSVGNSMKGAFTEISQRDTYVFNTGVNEKITFTVTRTAGEYAPAFQVFSPEGNAVAYCGAENPEKATVSCNFPSAGRYSIQVYDRSRIKTGEYEIALSRPA